MEDGCAISRDRKRLRVDDGIGAKLLAKMGYRGGGLGKNEQGIVSPIEPIIHPKNMGLGFSHHQASTGPVFVSVKPEKLLFSRRLSKINGKDLKYYTADESLAEKKEKKQAGFQAGRCQRIIFYDGFRGELLV
ncbi:hypothetical protein ACH5RR_013190 [Cinchona calisaya]|uniref:G-patch domain-containing protein n=1 Tax=Cinchona calisaya TaxID=153742 RepID=A0ABD2ZZT7_9GENT